ncbi:MAG: hypothetical protein R2845_00905 [Thermomicrobiales bacterium]
MNTGNPASNGLAASAAPPLKSERRGNEDIFCSCLCDRTRQSRLIRRLPPLPSTTEILMGHDVAMTHESPRKINEIRLERERVARLPGQHPGVSPEGFIERDAIHLGDFEWVDVDVIDVRVIVKFGVEAR